MFVQYAVFAGTSDRPEIGRALSVLQLSLSDGAPPDRGLASVPAYPLLAVLHCPQPDLVEVIGRLPLPCTAPSGTAASDSFPDGTGGTSAEDSSDATRNRDDSLELATHLRLSLTE
jgi:hypothetical protein